MKLLLLTGLLLGLAACETAAPVSDQPPLPKGTALPPPDFEAEPGNATDEPSR